MGLSEYDKEYMTDLDKAAIEASTKAWNTASAAGDRAAMDAAHAQAEAVRSKYSYSGGADGTQNLAKQSAQPLTYQSAPQYVSRYQEQLDGLTKQLLGREAFSYDAEKDPMYQQYRESYTRNGQKAMQDTLGQVAARTGGMASSYAATAAQQAYDGYMSALADKIPELKQLAYSMYQSEGDTLRNNLATLQGLEQSDYGRYLDGLGQWNTNRNYNYQLGRDQIADKRYDSELSRSTAAAKAETLGTAGDFSGYKALGYSDAEIATLKNAYARAQAAARLSGSSGGGSGSGSGSSSVSGSAGGYDALFEAAMQSGHAKSFIANNYKKYGFTSSSGLYDDYEDWELDGGGEAPKFGYAQLGAEAKRIADGMSRVANKANKASLASMIEAGMKKGTVSDEEADFLLRALGA